MSTSYKPMKRANPTMKDVSNAYRGIKGKVSSVANKISTGVKSIRAGMQNGKTMVKKAEKVANRKILGRPSVLTKKK